jgi:hypothetical protein
MELFMDGGSGLHGFPEDVNIWAKGRVQWAPNRPIPWGSAAKGPRHH